MLNQRRFVVRNPHQQRRAERVHGLLYAYGIDAGAGGIRHHVIIDQIFITVEEGMKGHIVQCAMRNDDQMTRA